MGRGYPLHIRLEGLGSVISSSSGVRDGDPAENHFSALKAFRILLVALLEVN